MMGAERIQDVYEQTASTHGCERRGHIRNGDLLEQVRDRPFDLRLGMLEAPVRELLERVFLFGSRRHHESSLTQVQTVASVNSAATRSRAPWWPALRDERRESARRLASAEPDPGASPEDTPTSALPSLTGSETRGRSMARHAGKLRIAGTAPDQLRFAHDDGRPYGAAPAAADPFAAARSALRIMGFAASEAAAAVERARALLDPASDLEAVIRASLRQCRPPTS